MIVLYLTVVTLCIESRLIRRDEKVIMYSYPLIYTYELAFTWSNFIDCSVFVAFSTTPSTLVTSTYADALTVNSTTFARTNSVSNFYYQTISIRVYFTGNYSIMSISSMDTYGYLYSSSFNPSNLNLNLVAQDDDSGGAVQFKLTVFLQTNINYVLVATTYSASVTGSFSIAVSGPSSVNLTQNGSISTTSQTSTATRMTTAAPSSK